MHYVPLNCHKDPYVGKKNLGEFRGFKPEQLLISVTLLPEVGNYRTDELYDMFAFEINACFHIQILNSKSGDVILNASFLSFWPTRLTHLR